MELRGRSTTLAYSLERFKPLAAHLDVCAFSDIPPTQDRGSLDSQGSDLSFLSADSSPGQRFLAAEEDLHRRPSSTRYKHVRLFRSHDQLCKFSDKDDKDLDTIITAINEICSKAEETVASKEPISE